MDPHIVTAPAKAMLSCIAALVVLAPSACSPRLQDALAEVNGHRITEVETAEMLRGLLWRRGEDWGALDAAVRQERRREALDALIEQQLIRELPDHLPEAAGKQGEERFQQFLKLFDLPDSWKERATIQGLSEAALVGRFVDEAAQESRLEERLATPAPALEAAARQWFEAHKKELTIPERVRASHIFLTRTDEVPKPDRDRTTEINQIHRQLTAHEASFAELAAKYSDDDRNKKSGGDLGWFSRARVPKEFADAVFALQPGQISEPVQSHLGWHIFLLKEKRPAHPATYEEAKDEIIAMLETKERKAALDSLLKDLKQKVKIVIDDERLARLEPPPQSA